MHGSQPEGRGGRLNIFEGTTAENSCASFHSIQTLDSKLKSRKISHTNLTMKSRAQDNLYLDPECKTTKSRYFDWSNISTNRKPGGGDQLLYIVVLSYYLSVN